MDEQKMIPEEQQDGFKIDSDSKAEWAVKRIKEAEREQNRLLALVDEERAELDVREKEILDNYAKKTDGLKALLEEYLRAQYAKEEARETNTQITYQLLSGKLVYKLTVEQGKALNQELKHNADVLVNWCKEHLPDAVNVTYTPKWAEIKKNIKVVDGIPVYAPTGEVVDGVEEAYVASKFNVV